MAEFKALPLILALTVGCAAYFFFRNQSEGNEEDGQAQARCCVNALKETCRTSDRVYLEGQGCFAKRTLHPSEFQRGPLGIIKPVLGKDRLQNEADCLNFLREHTSIPVPLVKHAFEDQGVFWLVTEFEAGDLLSHLGEDEKKPYLLELDDYVAQLHKLRSELVGGPRGLIIPPQRVFKQLLEEKWQLHQPNLQDPPIYVFCHNDLSEHNIIVNRAAGKIQKIIDWECAGFWPEHFEAKVYTRTGPRRQVVTDTSSNIERMSEFLRKCATK